MRRAIPVGLAILALAAPATAAAPGQNGKLAFAAVAADRWQIEVVEPDGTGRTPVATAAGIEAMPAWSHDGSRLAFVCGNFSICIANADGTGAVRLTDDSGWPAQWKFDLDPTWSPDNSKLAFASNRGGGWKIYVINADGTGMQPLAGSGRNDTTPAWSPDGTRIAFSADASGDSTSSNLDVWVMNADGTGARGLATTTSLERRPAWSPTGARIVYEREVERRISKTQTQSSLHLWTMNPDGTRKKVLTHGKGIELSPAWAPDGTRVAFSTFTGKSFDLRTSGRADRPPTTGPGVEIMADWQPAPATPSSVPAAALPAVSPASGDALVLAAFLATDFDLADTLFGRLEDIEPSDDESDIDQVFSTLLTAYAGVGDRAVKALGPLVPSTQRGKLLQATAVAGFKDVAAGARHLTQALTAIKKGQPKEAKRLLGLAQTELDRGLTALESASKLVGFSLF